MSYLELINYTIVLVMELGFIAYLLSNKYRMSNVPLFIIFGLLFGPVFNVIPAGEAHKMFNYVRVFGLMIILYTEGHNLKWFLIKKHIATIGILDTVGLLITALLAGTFFSLLFNLPFLAGFLFGAIISATDPATLIPLFKQNKVDEDLKTVIITESVFNDPLGIVLTTLAIALVVPQAQEAQLLESLAKIFTVYPAAVLFFLYEIISAILIGIIFGIIGYWIIKKIKTPLFPELIGLSMAFGGFLLGEVAYTSGYLVATTVGIIFGNHKYFFKKESKKNEEDFEKFLQPEISFYEKLSDLSSVFIFVLLGATINIETLGKTFFIGSLLALIIIFIVRPLSVLPVLILKKWSFKQYLFISLEGPRGIVPSAMAAMPLGLGILYKNEDLIYWGQVILSATLTTILYSEVLETLWVGYLNRKFFLKNKKT